MKPLKKDAEKAPRFPEKLFISLARQKVSKVSPPPLLPSFSFAASPQGNGQKIVDWGEGGKGGVRPCGLESGILLRGRTKKLFFHRLPPKTV